jgi:hypothetical protein
VPLCGESKITGIDGEPGCGPNNWIGIHYF